MPHYFFHLRTPASLERDDIGLEQLDLETAYLEACRAIPTLAAELIRKRVDPMRYAFEIADADDIPLLEVPFSETVRDTRRLNRRDFAKSGPLSEVDRTDALVTLVQRQVEIVREQVRASREWVRQAREANRRAE